MYQRLLPRLFVLWLCHLSSVFAGAVEPVNLAQIPDKDFPGWLLGTEWEYKSGENTRLIWFVTPNVLIYSRPDKSGKEKAAAYTWNVTKKGLVRFSYGIKDDQPYEVAVSNDLKQVTIQDLSDKKKYAGTFSGRPALPDPPKMTEVEFRAWLSGKSTTLEGMLFSFADGTVTVKGKDAQTHKLYFVRPGLIYYLHKDNPKDPMLMAFSTDLGTMQFWCWWGTAKGPVKSSGSAPSTTAKNVASGKGAVVTMNDVRPIRLAGNAASVNALLVEELGNSRFAGKAGTLSLTALELEGEKPGTLAFNQNVGSQMQAALQEVARFHALRNGGWPRGREMILTFEDKYSGKDGPSAAVACALLLESVIKGMELDSTFAVTGDLNADGSVQPVGGVHAKLRGATNFKCRFLGIPKKNAIHAMDIIQTEGLRPFLGIQVFAFSKFDEVVSVARSAKSPELAAAVSDFAALAKAVAAAPVSLRTQENIAKLQSILQRVPTHFSAQVLLLYATDRLPKTLSPAGTLSELNQATGDLDTAIRSDLTAATKLDGGLVAKARGALQRLRPIADARARTLVDAWVAWGNFADRLIRAGTTRSEADVKEWNNVIGRIRAEEQKLRTNEAFREDLK